MQYTKGNASKGYYRYFCTSTKFCCPARLYLWQKLINGKELYCQIGDHSPVGVDVERTRRTRAQSNVNIEDLEYTEQAILVKNKKQNDMLYNPHQKLRYSAKSKKQPIGKKGKSWYHNNSDGTRHNALTNIVNGVLMVKWYPSEMNDDKSNEAGENSVNKVNEEPGNNSFVRNVTDH